jgi:glycine/D-amino acid oxidase-like deaminating enzyme
MVSLANSMWSETTLPVRADVVIVGGGIVGVTAALFLREKGLSVALCEKGQIAGEQSGTNWGGVRSTGRDPREVPLSIQSLRLWREMNAKVGADTGFRQSGLAYLCDSPKDVAAHETWLKKVRGREIDARLISPNEIQGIMPGATRRWAGALYSPSDGTAEPQLAMAAIAAAAQRVGVSVATGCAVRGIETSAGRVSGAITERGRIACNALVLAGGIWSRLFCENLGVRLPVLTVISSVCRTGPVDGAPQCTAIASDFAFRRCLDSSYMVARPGGTITELVPNCFRMLADFLPVYWKQRKSLKMRVGTSFLRELRMPRRWSLETISPFESARALSARPARSILRRAQSSLALSFPVFRGISAIESWAGSIDVTPDGLPMISPIDALAGFYVACGFSGHGFGLGPGAGRLIADLVAGDAPIADPAPFRHARFAAPI